MKKSQINQADDVKRRTFAPIRMDLLDRLTRECDSKTDSQWDQPAMARQTDVPRRFRAG